MLGNRRKSRIIKLRSSSNIFFTVFDCSFTLWTMSRFTALSMHHVISPVYYLGGRCQCRLANLASSSHAVNVTHAPLGVQKYTFGVNWMSNSFSSHCKIHKIYGYLGVSKAESLTYSPHSWRAIEKSLFISVWSCLLCRGHSNAINCIAVHGHKVYSSGADCHIKVWDIGKLSKGCIQVMQGHTNPVSHEYNSFHVCVV